MDVTLRFRRPMTWAITRSTLRLNIDGPHETVDILVRLVRAALKGDDPDWEEED